MNKHRIVILDHHIIAQWYEHQAGWRTCSKANNNTEDDFAMWEETPANLAKARKLVGEDAPIIRNECKPYEGKHGWHTYAGEINEAPMSHNRALRVMAKATIGGL